MDKSPLFFQIRSDEEFTSPVIYSLKGKGATEHPVNLFIVDKNTGNVKITGILDREEIPEYNVSPVSILDT